MGRVEAMQRVRARRRWARVMAQVMAAAVLLGLCGCGVFDDDGLIGPLRRGYTDCGALNGEAQQCIPGQYCASVAEARCESGCLSDESCAINQLCVKADGQNVGACQRKDATNNATNNASNNTNNTSTDPCAEVVCDAPQVCQDGLCVDGAQGDPCAEVVCDAPQVCLDGLCVEPQTGACQITLDAQDGCPSDSLCVYADEDPESTATACQSFAPCGEGGLCDPGDAGAVCTSAFAPDKDPVCLLGACLDDAHCPAAGKCVRFDGEPIGLCSSGAAGEACADEGDCAEGLSCQEDTSSGARVCA